MTSRFVLAVLALWASPLAAQSPVQSCDDTPKPGAIGFIACLGGSVTAGETDAGM